MLEGVAILLSFRGPPGLVRITPKLRKFLVPVKSTICTSAKKHRIPPPKTRKFTGMEVLLAERTPQIAGGKITDAGMCAEQSWRELFLLRYQISKNDPKISQFFRPLVSGSAKFPAENPNIPAENPNIPAENLKITEELLQGSGEKVGFF